MRYAKLTTIVAMLIAILLTAIVVTADQKKLLPVRATFEQLTPAAQKEVQCLADNVLFEAGSEPQEGQVAVAIVTLNRVKSGNYQDSICGVVKQKTGTTCQFSWWCEAKPHIASTTRRFTSAQQELYNSVRDIALYVYLNEDKIADNTNGATYYHADYVNPGWKHLQKTVKIGRHIFYKNGEADGKHDAKIKSSVGNGRTNPLVFLTDGRNLDVHLQANYRMDL